MPFILLTNVYICPTETVAVDSSRVLFFVSCLSKIQNSLFLKKGRGNKESSIKNPFEMFM